MRALVVRSPGARPRVEEVRDPEPPQDGVVVRVRAAGLCRSDWHAWAGHDPDVVMPFVPGHELAGVVERVGPRVRRWAPGDRVTTPFVCGCGTCPTCRGGDPQVCPDQRQPGFTDDGAFAELVALHHADANLVALPDPVPGTALDDRPALDDVAAAALGCRAATAYRALVQRARVRAGEDVVVLGCGGLGLSAVMVARALGARVLAVDVSSAALARAGRAGAQVLVDARTQDVAAAVLAATDGGAHVAVEALGSQPTLSQALLSLRRRGRLVQVGLLPGGPDGSGHPRVPMERVVSHELDVLGSHGMAAADYPGLLALVASGGVRPGDLVAGTLSLQEAGPALANLGERSGDGVLVVEPWR